jgi:hypothetical protein
MFKKIVTVIIKHVIWPLLKIIFEVALMQLAEWIFEKLHDFLRLWQREEEATAENDKEREAMHKKYQRREADLARIREEIPQKVREIVRAAFIEANRETEALIHDVEARPTLKNAMVVKEPTKKKAPRKRAKR